MSFPRYSNYQDSGLNWLGEVPTHWSLRRLGYYFGERREKVSDREYQPLSVTKDGIVPQLETAAKTDDGDNRKRVCKGDFVINSRSDRKGSSGLSELDGSVSLISTVLKPKKSVHGPFVHYLLRCIPFQEEFYRFGKGIVADLWSTNYASMSGITLAVPPLSEQEVIANFLDRETAKIDALVAEQQRLIELLQEKRQAVISHAVTKGLNPNAPMKDSGVEWLGDVPAHWQIKKIKHVSTGFRYGTSEDCNSSDDGVPVLRIPNIKDGYLDTSDIKYKKIDTLSDHRYTLEKNDILVVRTNGNPSLVGKNALFKEDGQWLFASYLIMIRPRSEVTPEFLSASMNSSASREMLMLTARTSAGNYNMNCEGLGSTSIAMPPKEEQVEILSSTEEFCGRITVLVDAARVSIELLNERRSALISAAVTGQIDVRGLVEVEGSEQ